MPSSTTTADEADRLDGAPHPRFATTLIGHTDHERELARAYRQNRLPHAMIIGGSESTGKATLAWRLARFVLANPDWRQVAAAGTEDLSVDPDSKAASEVASLSHPDLVLLRREANDRTGRLYTEIRTDDVRRAIGLFQRGAGAGGYRICIVDSAEDLNRSSANALLKLIEEPPPLSLFLLVAHRPGLVLPTIRSRSRLLRLQPLSAGEVEQVVRTLGPPWTGFSDAEVSAAAAASQGSVADALRTLDDHDGGVRQAVRHVLDALPALDWRTVHRLADQVAGRNGEIALDLLLTTMRDWVAGTVRARAGRSPGELIAFAEFWEASASRAREAEALNLDKRALVLSLFADLAAAIATARS